MPSATAREFQRVAPMLGFVLVRQKGSHVRWSHHDGRVVTIPVHGGEEIGSSLIQQNSPAIRHHAGRIPEASLEVK